MASDSDNSASREPAQDGTAPAAARVISIHQIVGQVLAMYRLFPRLLAAYAGRLQPVCSMQPLKPKAEAA
jgi:hypothetical protein